MKRSALSRAGDWLRRLRPESTDSKSGRGDDRGAFMEAGDVKPLLVKGTDCQDKLTLNGILRGHAGDVSTADLRLLDFIGNDLSDRAQALRAAVRELDPTTSGSSLAAYQQSVEEIDRLEEMAHSICAIVQESSPDDTLTAVDLLDPIRRANHSLGIRRGSKLTLRVNTPASTPRVLAKPAVLVRTLGLCLEASTLAARDGGPILVRVTKEASDDRRLCAQFRAATALSVLAPALRQRLHTTIALATRLAATFGAEIRVDATDAGLAPRLSLLREGAL